MFRVALLLGCVYGFSAVILGAMGAHALQHKLTAPLLQSFQTGTKYQLTHAILLIVLGLWVSLFPSRWLFAAIIFVAVGVLLFSGSIYILTLLRWRVGVVTPIGGLCLIIGWIMMFLAAWFHKP